jgi:indolepyruvate ferredoxin oxidoreductase alpha subunit
MKHVGLNVAMDPLLSISYPGVNAGLVVVVVDDPGQHSSQNEQDTRYFGIVGKIPVLEPADSQECKDFVMEAFRISETFDTPVIVRLTTRSAHSQSLVTLLPRMDVPLKAHDTRWGKYIVAPACARKRRVVAEQRLHDLEKFAETTPLNQVQTGSSRIGIVSSGVAYQYAREVFPDANFFKLGLSHPLPRERMLAFAASCDTLYVIEEQEPIFEEKMRTWGLRPIGKEKLPVIGELSTEIVRKALTGDVKRLPAFDRLPDLPGRPPILCPGCHHRGPFYVMKKLGLHVSGDIGCYTLAAFPPLDSMETAICMGAGIGMVFGFEKARGRDFARNCIAVIGDSTFWHSGITGLIDIVYNRGVSTVMILDNSTTAMTGHQENPSTGRTLQGMPAVQLDFEKLVRAIGIEHVYEVDAFDVKALEEVIRRETQREAPSVIITRQPCVLCRTGRKAVREPVSVRPDMCRSCKRCLTIGCPAIQFSEKKAQVDRVLCTGCGVCVQVCPFGAILPAKALAVEGAI